MIMTSVENAPEMMLTMLPLEDILYAMACAFEREYKNRYGFFNPGLEIEYDIFKYAMDDIMRIIDNIQYRGWQYEMVAFPNDECEILMFDVRANHPKLETKIKLLDMHIMDYAINKKPSVIDFMNKLEKTLLEANKKIRVWNNMCENIKPYFMEELPVEEFLYQLCRELNESVFFYYSEHLDKRCFYDLDEILLCNFDIFSAMQMALPRIFGIEDDNWCFDVGILGVHCDGVLQVVLAYRGGFEFIVCEIEAKKIFERRIKLPLAMEFYEYVLDFTVECMKQWNFFLDEALYEIDEGVRDDYEWRINRNQLSTSFNTTISGTLLEPTYANQ